MPACMQDPSSKYNFTSKLPGYCSGVPASSKGTPDDNCLCPSMAVKRHALFTLRPLSISCAPPAPSVPRAAFEKDFQAYSKEKERQAQEASPITC